MQNTKKYKQSLQSRYQFREVEEEYSEPFVLSEVSTPNNDGIMISALV